VSRLPTAKPASTLAEGAVRRRRNREHP